MKLPKFIQVLHRAFEVKEVSADDMPNDNAGLIQYDRDLIWVSRDQSDAQVIETLLHEVHHAVNHVMGVSDATTEEDGTRRTSVVWLCVWRDNPVLLRTLSDWCEGFRPGTLRVDAVAAANPGVDFRESMEKRESMEASNVCGRYEKEETSEAPEVEVAPEPYYQFEDGTLWRALRPDEIVKDTDRVDAVYGRACKAGIKASAINPWGEGETVKDITDRERNNRDSISTYYRMVDDE